MTGRATWRRVVAGVVGAAVLVALALVGGSLASSSTDLARRQAVADAATTFATSLLSYDHADLGATRDRVSALVTEAFRPDVETTLDDLGADITELEATSTASVVRVLVQEPPDGATVHALVVVDVTVSSQAGTRELTGTHLDLALTSRDGAWLVDELRRLDAGRERRVDAPTEGPS